MPSCSSARMTRTAISPRLATRTFANMRREDYLVRSVADRAVALPAGALERDGMPRDAAPPADPCKGSGIEAVVAAVRPAVEAQDAGEPVVVVRCAPLHRGDVGLGAGAKRMCVPHRGPRYPKSRCVNRAVGRSSRKFSPDGALKASEDVPGSLLQAPHIPHEYALLTRTGRGTEHERPGGGADRDHPPRRLLLD